MMATLSDTCSRLRLRIEEHLQKKILPFWLDNAIDRERGGFVAEMSCGHVVNDQAPKGVVLNSRLLWTFSALRRCRRNPRFSTLAERAYATLTSAFWDPVHGGVYWEVDGEGKALDSSKKLYGQAFAIYAFSEFGVAFQRREALDRALALVALIEEHCHDDAHGGYMEGAERDWRPAGDSRLTASDMNEKKSMNAHLHLLEAYTRLLSCNADRRVQNRLTELVELFLERIVTPDRRHLNHFFDESWRCRSDTYTYGHDIEASWLLCEAAAVLDDSAVRRRVEEQSLKLARATLEEAVDPLGGIASGGRNGRATDLCRVWWTQAEASVGFLNAYRLTSDPVYLETVVALWNFIERYLVDPDGGEWFWRIDEQGRPDRDAPKLSQWKSPYHNTRSCLESSHRLSTYVIVGRR